MFWRQTKQEELDSLSIQSVPTFFLAKLNKQLQLQYSNKRAYIFEPSGAVGSVVEIRAAPMLADSKGSATTVHSGPSFYHTLEVGYPIFLLNFCNCCEFCLSGAASIDSKPKAITEISFNPATLF